MKEKLMKLGYPLQLILDARNKFNNINKYNEATKTETQQIIPFKSTYYKETTNFVNTIHKSLKINIGRLFPNTRFLKCYKQPNNAIYQ